MPRRLSTKFGLNNLLTRDNVIDSADVTSLITTKIATDTIDSADVISLINNNVTPGVTTGKAIAMAIVFG